MNIKLMNPKVVAGVATALFIVSLVGFMNEYRVSSSLEHNLKGEKLHSEKLLSQKLSLEKDLEKFKGQIASLTGNNAELDRMLNEAKHRLAGKEAEYRKLQQEASSLKNIKKKHDAMAALRIELERTISDLTNTLTRLQLENNDMANTIASLQERNNLLNEELYRAQFASLDQPRIETVKGKKERLTVSARKTRKMKVNVDIPAGLQNISFRITDPRGSVLSPKDGTIASRVIHNDESLSASADNSIDEVKKYKQMEMVYLANKKLQPGIYKIEILTDNLYVGSSQVKLK